MYKLNPERKKVKNLSTSMNIFLMRT